MEGEREGGREWGGGKYVMRRRERGVKGREECDEKEEKWSREKG